MPLENINMSLKFTLQSDHARESDIISQHNDHNNIQILGYTKQGYLLLFNISTFEIYAYDIVNNENNGLRWSSKLSLDSEISNSDGTNILHYSLSDRGDYIGVISESGDCNISLFVYCLDLNLEQDVLYPKLSCKLNKVVFVKTFILSWSRCTNSSTYLSVVYDNCNLLLVRLTTMTLIIDTKMNFLLDSLDSYQSVQVAWSPSSMTIVFTVNGILFFVEILPNINGHNFNKYIKTSKLRIQGHDEAVIKGLGYFDWISHQTVVAAIYYTPKSLDLTTKSLITLKLGYFHVPFNAHSESLSNGEDVDYYVLKSFLGPFQQVALKLPTDSYGVLSPRLFSVKLMSSLNRCFLAVLLRNSHDVYVYAASTIAVKCSSNQFEESGILKFSSTSIDVWSNSSQHQAVISDLISTVSAVVSKGVDNSPRTVSDSVLVRIKSSKFILLKLCFSFLSYPLKPIYNQDYETNKSVSNKLVRKKDHIQNQIGKYLLKRQEKCKTVLNFLKNEYPSAIAPLIDAFWMKLFSFQKNRVAVSKAVAQLIDKFQGYLRAPNKVIELRILSHLMTSTDLLNKFVTAATNLTTAELLWPIGLYFSSLESLDSTVGLVFANVPKSNHYLNPGSVNSITNSNDKMFFNTFYKQSLRGDGIDLEIVPTPGTIYSANMPNARSRQYYYNDADNSKSTNINFNEVNKSDLGILYTNNRNISADISYDIGGRRVPNSFVSGSAEFDRVWYDDEVNLIHRLKTMSTSSSDETSHFVKSTFGISSGTSRESDNRIQNFMLTDISFLQYKFQVMNIFENWKRQTYDKLVHLSSVSTYNSRYSSRRKQDTVHNNSGDGKLDVINLFNEILLHLEQLPNPSPLKKSILSPISQQPSTLKQATFAKLSPANLPITFRSPKSKNKFSLKEYEELYETDNNAVYVQQLNKNYPKSVSNLNSIQFDSKSVRSTPAKGAYESNINYTPNGNAQPFIQAGIKHKYWSFVANTAQNVIVSRQHTRKFRKLSLKEVEDKLESGNLSKADISSFPMTLGNLRNFEYPADNQISSDIQASIDRLNSFASPLVSGERKSLQMIPDNLLDVNNEMLEVIDIDQHLEIEYDLNKLKSSLEIEFNALKPAKPAVVPESSLSSGTSAIVSLSNNNLVSSKSSFNDNPAPAITIQSISENQSFVQEKGLRSSTSIEVSEELKRVEIHKNASDDKKLGMNQSTNVLPSNVVRSRSDAVSDPTNLQAENAVGSIPKLNPDISRKIEEFSVAGPSIQSASLKTSITPKEIVEAIYKSCNPSKVSEISKLLEKYKGKEDDLIRKLESKYNVKSSDFFGVKSTEIIAQPIISESISATTPASPGASSASGHVNSVISSSPFTKKVQSPMLSGSNVQSQNNIAQPILSQSTLNGGVSLFNKSPQISPNPTSTIPSIAPISMFAQPKPVQSSGLMSSFQTPLAPPGTFSTTSIGNSQNISGPSFGISGGLSQQSMTPIQIIREIYRQCNPDKLTEVPALLVKYKGNEETLVKKLEKKYGVNSQDIIVKSNQQQQSTQAIKSTGDSLFNKPVNSNLSGVSISNNIGGMATTTMNMSSPTWGQQPQSQQGIGFGNSNTSLFSSSSGSLQVGSSGLAATGGIFSTPGVSGRGGAASIGAPTSSLGLGSSLFNRVPPTTTPQSAAGFGVPTSSLFGNR